MQALSKFDGYLIHVLRIKDSLQREIATVAVITVFTWQAHQERQSANIRILAAPFKPVRSEMLKWPMATVFCSELVNQSGVCKGELIKSAFVLSTLSM